MTETPTDPHKVALRPRNVHWDWTDLPMHYLGNDPVATQYINAFNMILPEGEVFFVRTFQEALPYITDDTVRDDVLGFIGQEAVHSASHQSVLEHFTDLGFATAAYTDQVRWLFRGLFSDRELDGRKKYSWLVERVAIVAAAEHITSYLGNWALNATAWDRALEPRMRDLLLWHLAEEVEHRHVAFDLFTHLDGSYWRRIRAHVVTYPMFVYLLYRGLRFLTLADSQAPTSRLALLRQFRRAARKGLVPGFSEMAKMAMEYFRPRYHPCNYGSTSQAVAYLASSPAVQAAATV